MKRIGDWELALFCARWKSGAEVEKSVRIGTKTRQEAEEFYTMQARCYMTDLRREPGEYMSEVTAMRAALEHFAQKE
jgi:hypothetical protein